MFFWCFVWLEVLIVYICFVFLTFRSQIGGCFSKYFFLIWTVEVDWVNVWNGKKCNFRWKHAGKSGVSYSLAHFGVLNTKFCRDRGDIQIKVDRNYRNYCYRSSVMWTFQYVCSKIYFCLVRLNHPTHNFGTCGLFVINRYGLRTDLIDLRNYTYFLGFFHTHCIWMLGTVRSTGFELNHLFFLLEISKWKLKKKNLKRQINPLKAHQSLCNSYKMFHLTKIKNKTIQPKHTQNLISLAHI